MTDDVKVKADVSVRDNRLVTELIINDDGRLIFELSVDALIDPARVAAQEALLVQAHTLVDQALDSVIAHLSERGE